MIKIVFDVVFDKGESPYLMFLPIQKIGLLVKVIKFWNLEIKVHVRTIITIYKKWNFWNFKIYLLHFQSNHPKNFRIFSKDHIFIAKKFDSSSFSIEAFKLKLLDFENFRPKNIIIKTYPGFSKSNNFSFLKASI